MMSPGSGWSGRGGTLAAPGQFLPPEGGLGEGVARSTWSAADGRGAWAHGRHNATPVAAARRSRPTIMTIRSRHIDRSWPGIPPT